MHSLPVNFNRPGQIGRPPMGLLVKVVAPAPDGLRQSDARDDKIQAVERIELPAAAQRIPGQHAGNQPAVNRKPALANIQYFK